MNLADTIANINWLAVIVSTVAAFGLGGLWYSKALFGKTWMQEVGLTEDSVNNANMLRIFGTSFVLQLIAATALAAYLGADSTWRSGLHTGLWISLFWIATAYGVTYLFEQRTLRLFLINAGYYVVLFAITGTIIGAWH